MGATLEDPALEARGLATSAARRCGLTVEIVDDPASAGAAADLLQRIWRTTHGTPVAPELLLALTRTGNYAAVARLDGELVAASAAFRTGDAEPHLHSHITGVVPEHHGRSVGYAMKLHQRSWALEHGCSEISWTFDPMQARNAYFNLVKLGATFDAYLPDFYGEMGDEINRGALGDRGLIRWDTSATLPDLPRPALDLASVTPLLEPRGDGIAALPDLAPLGAELVSIAVPTDVGALRARDPERALRWHRAVREAFAAALSAGYAVTSFDPDHHYVLRKGTHAPAPS